jgi:hypothetical protein
VVLKPPAKTADGKAGSAEPEPAWKADEFLRPVLQVLLDTNPKGRNLRGWLPAFVGWVARGDEDFRIDRPWSLDRRLDFVVEWAGAVADGSE